MDELYRRYPLFHCWCKRLEASVLVFEQEPSSLRIKLTSREQANATLIRRGSHDHITQRFSAILPVNYFDDVTLTSSLGQLDQLTIGPPNLANYQQSRNELVKDICDVLPAMRGLVELTLPFDLSSGLQRVLLRVSALPDCTTLTINNPDTDLFSLSRHIPALVDGLRGFHHLRKLSLPSNAIFPSVHRCLGDLRGLKALKLQASVASSRFPTHLEDPRSGDFPVLRTLKVIGTYSDLNSALRAFANPEANVLRNIRLKCCFFSTKGEAATFRAMRRRCPFATFDLC